MKLTLAILLLVFAASSQGTTITYSAVLSGANEVPPVTTAGTGFTTVTYDSIAHTLSIAASFSGLTGTTTAAHIHCCALPGTNAGVATTTPSFVGFPLGVTAGTYNNTLDLTVLGSWNPAFITSNGGSPGSAEAAFATGFAEGKTYLNIHTTFAPGGEIRALLVPVPEPATWTLFSGSLLLLLTASRKRLHR